MSSAFGILLVILTILGMEGVAYVAHRWANLARARATGS